MARGVGLAKRVGADYTSHRRARDFLVRELLGAPTG